MQASGVTALWLWGLRQEAEQSGFHLLVGVLCAVFGGRLKANKNPSVGGQTPAFCSSPGCSEPLAGLSFPV